MTQDVEKPLISVLMTCYNREKYIAEAIESVLSSTYQNFELIIVDDCSNDKTVEIAKAYKSKDKRIRFYENEHNLTQWPNRNKAAGLAIGSLIMWVDSDDEIQPDAIEYVVQQFMIFPEIKFSTIYHKNDIQIPTVLSSERSIRNHFFKEGFLNIGPGGTAIKTIFFKSIGGFPETYGPIGDMYFNLKAASNSDVLLLPYNYLIYRRHEGQEINNSYSYLCDGFRYLSDAMELQDLPLSEKEKKIILKKSARANVRSLASHIKNTGEIKKAWQAFRISGIRIMDLF